MTMAANWQLLITLLIVAVSAGYLGRRGFRLLRKKSGACGEECGGCGTGGSKRKEVVQLTDDFSRPAR